MSVSKNSTHKIIYNNDFADKVALLCYNFYNGMAKNGKPKQGEEWTLLSGIVLCYEGNLEVVALGTGTKCLGRSVSVSAKGYLVNDSHAEVIARRSFLRYIYDQLRLLKNTGSSKILINKASSNERKYCLKENVSFHFFTSHVPCGDASIVPMTLKEREIFLDEGNSLGEPSKKKHCPISTDGSKILEEEIGEAVVDVFRTGAKPVSNGNLEGKEGGVGYHITGLVRTKPGRGERTLSVSCSDKIARWIYQGIQGNLLDKLLKSPIYLSTITVGGGGQFCMDSLERGLITRWSRKTDEKDYELPVLLHSELIFESSKYACVRSRVPCPTSIIWASINHGSCLTEILVNGRLHGLTKKAIAKGKGLSALSKMKLFEEFSFLMENYQREITYRQVKNSNISYKNKSDKFKTLIGNWTEKPLEIDDFPLVY